MITMIPSQSPNRYQQGQIDRKFGMFVHYGINTFLNQEWSDGTAAPSTYAPQDWIVNSGLVQPMKRG